MADAVRDLDGVTFHDLYETYPDGFIDVAHEQGLVLQHDALVLQHPFYWYSTPALLKEWQDLVLEHGWAYGEGGVALRGKDWMHALTAGGSEDSYRAEGANKLAVEALLAPLRATADLCGMRWHAPYAVFASRLKSDSELHTAAAAYRARILALQRHAQD